MDDDFNLDRDFDQIIEEAFNRKKSRLLDHESSVDKVMLKYNTKEKD